jgi:hypothetical protein
VSKYAILFVAFVALFLLSDAGAQDASVVADYSEDRPKITLEANEEAAIADLKTLYDLCHVYYDAHLGYPENMPILAAEVTGNVPKRLVQGEGEVSGYQYAYSCVDRNRFEIYAYPPDKKKKQFYIDQRGEVRLNDAFGPLIQ